KIGVVGAGTPPNHPFFSENPLRRVFKYSMTLPRLLTLWRNTPQIIENIARWETIPARKARLVPFPADLHPALASVLRAQGIESLYAHQAQAYEHARAGRNLVVATGTASGKTLCYNLPILDRLLRAPEARALYLFPTKALARDQWAVISDQLSVNSGQLSVLNTAAYDGDTPRSQRPKIRANAHLIISNPDMLHFGVLPYHTRWGAFFPRLQFVVIDEIHIYRGVFGSHVANVLRRLKRIAAFYGASPQFILTSATIANPVELAEKLIEAPVTLIDEDGSARGRQHFLIYNPPIVDEKLGLRRGILQESVYLAGDLLAYDVQTLVFARSRRAVELTLRYLQAQSPPSGWREEGRVRAYRSGYLPAQRREIEHGLRSGQVRAVAATNALELGIDIGGMGAVVLAGYPGAIAATWQQAGRAGRGSDESLAGLPTPSISSWPATRNTSSIAPPNRPSSTPATCSFCSTTFAARPTSCPSRLGNALGISRRKP
ncbi:MAG: DEAD/DEAH box helicase, partial [Anaerolineales bacterium]